MADTVGKFDVENQFIQRKTTSTFSNEKASKPDVNVESDQVGEKDEGDVEKAPLAAASDSKYRVFVLIGLAALILGWWISATILKATRGRWYDILSLLKKLLFDYSPKASADNLCVVFLNVRSDFSHPLLFC